MVHGDESDSETAFHSQRTDFLLQTHTHSLLLSSAQPITAHDLHTTDDPAAVVSPSCDAD